MNFINPELSILFLVFTLAVYYILARRYQNIWLFVASLGFLIQLSLPFTIVLLALVAFNYSIALILSKQNAPKTWLLWLGISGNVIVWAFLREQNFFLEAFRQIFGQVPQVAHLVGLDLLVPIGISFIFVQGISYLVDVAKSRIEPTRNFLYLSLYLIYFPKLISGPIERAGDFFSQLSQPRTVNGQTIWESFALIIAGLFRKLVIADFLLVSFIQQNFEPVPFEPQNFDSVALLLRIIAYAVYLYNDFAGYIHIARGISQLFGIELSQNFKQPYFAHSFSDFWNRWHITLSNLLRDYIFYPISRILRKRYRSSSHFLNLFIPPMITMLASGLWHGFSWHMLVWGGLHGLYLFCEQVLHLLRSRLRRDALPKTGSNILAGFSKTLSIVLVFGFVSLAWVPFELTLPQTLSYFRQLFTFTGTFQWYPGLLVWFGLSLGLDFLSMKTDAKMISYHWPAWLRNAALALGIFMILSVMIYNTSAPFVYQGF